MIYLIGGLATNQKIFAKLDLGGRPFTHLPWIKPEKNESLDSYLGRFAKAIIPGEEIILIGTSLGGMISQQLSQRFQVKKIILISSIVSEKEFSPLIRFLKATCIYKIISIRLLLKLRFILYHFFSSQSEQEKKELIDLIIPDVHLIRWSSEIALHWNNSAMPAAKIYRIHGTYDLVFPHKYIGEAHLVKGGTHLMILRNAEEINKWLKQVLDTN
jgi:pimeloyl-ACP methyl ester carboxylesterase